MDNETKESLHRQLVKLGDMMGDGLHHEPGGEWISKEYKRVLKALGIGPKRKNNSAQINELMSKRVQNIKCPKCNGEFKQSRSGSMRAKCLTCKSVFQLLTRNKKRSN
jgi:transposase-like protein